MVEVLWSLYPIPLSLSIAWSMFTPSSVLSSLMNVIQHSGPMIYEVSDGIFYLTTQYWGFRFWTVIFSCWSIRNSSLHKFSKYCLIGFIPTYENTIFILYCLWPKFKIMGDNFHFLEHISSLVVQYLCFSLHCHVCSFSVSHRVSWACNGQAVPILQPPFFSCFLFSVSERLLVSA